MTSFVAATGNDNMSLSSGQTKKTTTSATSTALTVRQSNVNVNDSNSKNNNNNNNNNNKSKTMNLKSLLPPLANKTTKKQPKISMDPPLTTNNDPVKKNRNKNNDGNSNDGNNNSNNILYSKPDSPLPPSRVLAKVLCRIVDDEAYTRNDALLALQRLHQWSQRQDVKFSNSLVGMGGIQQVLFFVEDHLNDPETIGTALLLLETLTTPIDDYESKALTNMRTKISSSVIEADGIELLLRAFQFHALPEQNVTTNNKTSASSDDKTTTIDDETTSASTTYQDFQKEHESLWNTFKTIMNCEAIKDENFAIDNIVLNTCSALSGADPTESITKQTAANSAKQLRLSEKAINTSILSMKVLSMVVPHAKGDIPDKSAAILSALVDVIPTLLADDSLSSKTKPTTSSRLSTSSSKYAKQEKEALIASVLACLVSGVRVAQNTILKANKATSKQVIGVTVQIMKEFPGHPQIIRDGCYVLQGVCPNLDKSERKRLGVVAALATVVASDTMKDKKVKEIADTILEEQFK